MANERQLNAQQSFLLDSTIRENIAFSSDVVTITKG